MENTIQLQYDIAKLTQIKIVKQSIACKWDTIQENRWLYETVQVVRNE